MEPPTLELPSSVHTSCIELGTFEIFLDFSALEYYAIPIPLP
jgi:hypothetical protein